ncbi:MAG: hypothetical protein NUV49_02035 [Patescibacteria group bacterium]|nr:hypothetical protein [Patescibacteria group bacterium]
MKRLLLLILCPLWFMAHPAQAQDAKAKYFGTAEAGLNKAKAAMADSGFFHKADVADTLEAKGVYPDSLAGVPRLEAQYHVAAAHDSTNSAANSQAIGDVAGLNDRLGEKKTTASFKSSLFGEVFPIPTAVDTTIDGTVPCLNDSLWGQPRSIVSTITQYSVFHRILGEQASGEDTTTVSIVVHFPVALSTSDSVAVWVRSDDAEEGDVDITITSLDGTVVLTTEAITCIADNTWERKVFAFDLAETTPQSYLIVYRYRCTATHYIDVSGVKFVEGL